jgi:hypothetical protein
MYKCDTFRMQKVCGKVRKKLGNSFNGVRKWRHKRFPELKEICPKYETKFEKVEEKMRDFNEKLCLRSEVENLE